MKITTHNGQFHADEVVAFTFLKFIMNDIEFERTRNLEIIESSDIVIDVGMKYEPDMNRFDHHQDSCNITFSEKYNIPMSSAGMVYKKYGKEYLNKLLSDEIEDELYYEFYDNVIKEIDAIDNGIKNQDMNFYIQTGISRMISRFNYFDVFDEQKQYEQFYKASNYAQNILEIIANDLYMKRKLFNDEYSKIKEIINNTSEKYIIVNFDCINWYKCIMHYYNENKDKNKIEWIVYKDNKNWRIRTISNESKKLKDENYLKNNITHPEQLLFVHKAKFIASAETLETIEEIAKLSY